MDVSSRPVHLNDSKPSLLKSNQLKGSSLICLVVETSSRQLDGLKRQIEETLVEEKILSVTEIKVSFWIISFY